jgi:hypothetical protein
LPLASVEVLGLSSGQSHDDFEYVPDSLHYSAHLFEDFFTLHLETDMFLEEAIRDQVTVMSLQVQHTYGLEELLHRHPGLRRLTIALDLIPPLEEDWRA